MNFRDNINELQRATVFDRDGDKIGSVGQVYVHNGTENPSWVTVNTGLFGTKETFIPLDDAQFNNGDIHVPYEKSFVKDAPNLDENGEINRQQEDELYRYYGVTDPGVGGGAGTGKHRDGDRDLDGRRDDLRDNDRHSFDRDIADRGRTDEFRDGDRRDGDLDNDETVTLHEEQVNVGTETVEKDRLRLRKHVVTDTVPSSAKKSLWNAPPLRAAPPVSASTRKRST